MGQLDNFEYFEFEPGTTPETHHKWNLAAKPYIPQVQTQTTPFAPQGQTQPSMMTLSPDSPTLTNSSDYFSQGSMGTGIGSNFSSIMSTYNTTPVTHHHHSSRALLDPTLLIAQMSRSPSVLSHTGGSHASPNEFVPSVPMLQRPMSSHPTVLPGSEPPVEQRDVRSTLSQRLDKFTKDFLNAFPYPTPGPIINMGRAILDGTYCDRLLYREEHENVPPLIGKNCPWNVRDHREMPSMLDIWEPLGKQQSPTAELLRYQPEAIVEFCRGRLID